jgi:hypothetical protein
MAGIVPAFVKKKGQNDIKVLKLHKNKGEDLLTTHYERKEL